MTLPNGHYRTAAGSEMWISGTHAGKSVVEFDWIEEDNACLDCVPEAYDSDGWLVWHCDYCGGGRAELVRVGK
ncbi:MAG: hypothetical protein NUV75_02185 [Gallionella sp.]|nr:hypothetical protein [Gallionella sp.]